MPSQLSFVLLTAIVMIHLTKQYAAMPVKNKLNDKVQNYDLDYVHTVNEVTTTKSEVALFNWRSKRGTRKKNDKMKTHRKHSKRKKNKRSIVTLIFLKTYITLMTFFFCVQTCYLLAKQKLFLVPSKLHQSK